MRIILPIFILLILSSCKEEGKLPEGFEDVSRDARSHFVFVHKPYVGDKIGQREAARIICKEIYKELDYCEVYFFDKRSAIPVKFPMINRIAPLGIYSLKDGKEKFKTLSENDTEASLQGDK